MTLDADERALLAQSVAAALTATGSDGADAALAQLGWPEMLATDATTTAAIVFEQLGRLGTRSGALDGLMAHHLGLAPDGLAVVHPAWGGSAVAMHLRAGQVTGEGTAGPGLGSQERIGVLLADGLAEVAASALTADPARPDALVTVVRCTGADVLGHRPIAPQTVEAAWAPVRVAIGHQLCGIAAAMLELARAHAVDRIQFGRPIASFQAVRHKLADTLVAVEAAREALAAADESDDPLACDLARVLAGQAAATASRHGQQILAGIGFTREHDFHRLLFAALELDGPYGTTGGITVDIGTQLLTSGSVPRVVDL